MRIVIVANDTRGGVEPYAALARAFDSRGHDAVLVAPADFHAIVEGSGVRFVGLSGASRSEMGDSTGATTATERGPVASMRVVAGELGSRIRTWTAETLAAGDGAELFLGGVGGMVVGLSVAEMLGVPFVPAHLQPVDAPTADYPGVLLPRVRPSRLGHRLTSLALWTPFARPMAAARRDVLGLTGRRPTPPADLPSLYGISPHVLRVPGAHRHTTGYWFGSEPTWSPSQELTAFVAEGPVVSIGFGSMATRNPSEVTAAVRAAVESLGTKAVILSGAGGVAARDLADLGSRVMVVESVPHAWLFPRMSAIVHHGGAGTTAAALRAGVPSVVVPFTVDQPFWGLQVSRLGVGPDPIPRRRLTGPALAHTLEIALTDARMIDRARVLGTAIRAEDGVTSASELLERSFA